MKYLLWCLTTVILIFCYSVVAAPALEYRSYDLPTATIHIVTIPNTKRVSVAVADRLQNLEQFAEQEGAVAVLNGGFFDPNNQLTTSYVFQEGKLVADPKQNANLINNPDLGPYLDQILNRREWRSYQCPWGDTYQVTRRQDPLLPDCTLQDVLGAGPGLVPQLTAEEEGFVTYQEGKMIRDPLGINQKNARTAIALTKSHQVLWVMVAQKPEIGPNSGLSLAELAAFLQGLGVETALNLDGGSSSSLYWQGDTIPGKLTKEGTWLHRPVKSVLIVK